MTTTDPRLEAHCEHCGAHPGMECDEAQPGYFHPGRGDGIVTGKDIAEYMARPVDDYRADLARRSQPLTMENPEALPIRAYVAGYMAAVNATIGHTRQILSPIVWEDIIDRQEERASKEGALWVRREQ